LAAQAGSAITAKTIQRINLRITSFLHLIEEFQAKDSPLAELRNSLSAVILIGAKKRRKLALNEAEAELMLLFWGMAGTRESRSMGSQRRAYTEQN
jgi:hypothetical protein